MKMHSEYIYNYVLSMKEKLEIGKLIREDVPMKYIVYKYKLSAQFIKYQYRNILNVVPTCLGSKTEAYYEDEMDYGLKSKKDLKY